jgi:hypothetical protein
MHSLSVHPISQTYTKLLKSTYRLQHNSSGDFNTPLPQIGRSFKQKNQQKILELSNTIDQMDKTDVYRIFHPKIAQYTFFSATHGTFSKINHIWEQKPNPSKYNKIEITPYILYGHNALKLELNNKNNSRKYPNN